MSFSTKTTLAKDIFLSSHSPAHCQNNGETSTYPTTPADKLNGNCSRKHSTTPMSSRKNDKMNAQLAAISAQMGTEGACGALKSCQTSSSSSVGLFSPVQKKTTVSKKGIFLSF